MGQRHSLRAGIGLELEYDSLAIDADCACRPVEHADLRQAQAGAFRLQFDADFRAFGRAARGAGPSTLGRLRGKGRDRRGEHAAGDQDQGVKAFHRVSICRNKGSCCSRNSRP